MAEWYGSHLNFNETIQISGKIKERLAVWNDFGFEYGLKVDLVGERLTATFFESSGKLIGSFEGKASRSSAAMETSRLAIRPR